MRMVATIKPGDDADERVRVLLSTGITCFRVNFARRDVRANEALVAELAVRREQGTVEAVFADLPGRKARLWPIAGKRRPIGTGEVYRVYGTPVDEQPGVFGLTDRWVLDRLRAGDAVTIGDVTFVVDDVDADGGGATLRATGDGEVYNRCAVQVPHERYTAATVLVPDDHAALARGAWRADFVCVSFADSPALMDEAAALRSHGRHNARLIAKIESPAAVEALDSIAESSDGLLLGRGDLAGFYDEDGMDDIGRRLLEAGKATNGVVVFATDYLRSVAAGGTTDDATPEGAARLRRAAEDGVDYLVLNETATSDNWARVGAVAAALQEAEWR